MNSSQKKTAKGAFSATLAQATTRPSIRWPFSKENTLIAIASIFINLLGLVFPLFILQIYDRIIPNQSIGTLLVLIALVITAVALEVLLKILRAISMSWASVRTEYLQQQKMVKALLNADMKTYEERGVGEYLECFRSVSALRENLSGQNLVHYVDIPFALVFITLVAYLGGALVLIPLCLLGLLVYIHHATAQKIREFSALKKDNESRRSNYLVELLTAIHTVKTLALEKFIFRRYERLQTRETELNYNLRRSNTTCLNLVGLIAQLNTILIVSFGSILVVKGHMTMGGLAACTLLSSRMMQPVNRILSQKQADTAQAEAIRKLSMIEDITQEAFDPQAQKTTLHAGEIQLEQLTFAYDKKPLFNQINLTIPAKATIAITGNSASGKSTLLQLITGLLSPDSGRILLDGQDIQAYNADYLHKAIIYLSQEHYLFSGTILDNLTMFKEIHQEKAYELSRALGLEPLLIKLPHGYHTEVGTTAVELLSPGIKQLITIVRALVSEQLKILLFDEANMALDLPSDFDLIKFLENLRKHCTMILVSYRPSILNLASQRYVIEGGALHEQKDSR